jgi:hypothetical protein
LQYRKNNDILPAVKYFSTIVLILLSASCSSHQSKLEDKEQTIELHYIAWACDCANWATTSDIAKYHDNIGDTLARLCICVEPADSSLQLPDDIGQIGVKVKFTGRFYKEKGFPANYTSNEYPDKARVFRYTRYRIIKRS